MADQQRLPDVWASRDLAVLVEVTLRKDEGEDLVQASDIAEALGIAEEQVVRAGYALKRRGLFTASGSMAAEIETFDEVSAEAYFLTRLHPSGDDARSAPSSQRCGSRQTRWRTRPRRAGCAAWRMPPSGSAGTSWAAC